MGTQFLPRSQGLGNQYNLPTTNKVSERSCPLNMTFNNPHPHTPKTIKQ